MADFRPDFEDHSRIKRRKRAADMDSNDSDSDGGVPINAGQDTSWNQKPTDWSKHQSKKLKPIKKEKDGDSKPIKDEEEDVNIRLDPSGSRVKAEPAVSKQDQYAESPVKNEPAAERKYNPYLAHMDQQLDSSEGYGNGYGHFQSNKLNGAPSGTTIGLFPRHQTTAAMAKKAEDGPNNPFNGRPLSNMYFSILKTRRNLPVHAQR